MIRARLATAIQGCPNRIMAADSRADRASPPALGDAPGAPLDRANASQVAEIPMQGERGDSRSTSRSATKRDPRKPYAWKLGNVRQVQSALARVARGTQRGEIPPARARALVTTLAALLRSMESSEVAADVKKLEAALAAKGLLR